MRDYGNDRVRERTALFDAMCIKGGKATDQVADGIGQLWALDFLDGHGFDDRLLRDAGRDYGRLYWTRHNDKAPKISEFERSDRAKQSYDDTRSDLRFERWADDLKSLPYERQVLEHVVVDYLYSDGAAGFVERLVSTELLKRGRVPRMFHMEEIGDRATLGALIAALKVLVDGVVESRRAA
jgi:hypothetical protein